MKVFWTERAAADINELHRYISRDNPAAADRLAERVESTVDTLAHAPLAGRKGRVRGTRELVILGTPCVVAYKVEGDFVPVIAVVRGKQSWPAPF